MWPFSKKKEVKQGFNTEEFVIPNKETLDQLVEGNYNCQVVAAQHVNWAYNYLGSGDRVYPFTPILNKHFIILTGAAVKYVESL